MKTIGNRLRTIAKQRGSDLIRLSVSYSKYPDEKYPEETFRAVVTDERFGIEEIAAVRDSDCAVAVDCALDFAGKSR
jgi:hypothetical protein